NCKYDSCYPYIARETDDCCGGCCGKSGAGVVCRRYAYNGNPVACCLNDFGGCNFSQLMEKSSTTNNCFSSSVAGEDCNDFSSDCAGTCDPCLRDVTSDPNTFYAKIYDPQNGSLTDYYVCKNYGGAPNNH